MKLEIKEGFLKNLLMLWAGLSILLIAIGLIVFYKGFAHQAFVGLLNAVNAVCWFLVFAFRRHIESYISTLAARTKNLAFYVHFNHERKIGAVLLSLSTVFGMGVVFLSFYSVDLYSELISEDGIVEYSSAVFWFLAVIIMVVYTARLLKMGTQKPTFTFNLLLILFFFLCAGEEISWGQRLFDIETPQLLKEVNVQNEITLHNIGSISVFSNIFFVICVTFFLCVPFLAQKYNRIRDIFYYVDFPVPNRFATYIFIVTLLVWVCIGVRFGTLGFHPFSLFEEQYYTQMDDEIFEFFAAYTFLCFSIFNSVKVVSVKGQELTV